jgi:hypothetical protein
MNWIVFTLAAWGLLGLELGLKDVLRIGDTSIAPSLVFPLAVVVSLAAPATTTLWACLLLGAAVDLTYSLELVNGGPARIVLGPYALGYLLAGQLVLTMRALMIRKSFLTVGFLSLFGSVVCHIVVTAIFALRGRYDELVAFDASQQLLWRLGSSVYTGIAGLIIGAVAMPALGALGLHVGPPRRFARRTG